jgi:hypothetical protein
MYKSRKGPVLLVLLALAFPGYGRCQYQKDIDRDEINELRKKTPPPGAIELKLIRAFPTPEQEEAGRFLPQPDSFAQDRLGNYYIADQLSNVIYVYDSSGNYINQLGRPGQGPGDLSLPRHIAVFDDVVHINDVGNRRIQYFDLKGQVIRTNRIFKSYTDLKFTRDGQIVGAPLIVEDSEDVAMIDILASDGKLLRSFGAPFKFKYDQSSMNDRIILINKKGEVILVYRFLSVIQKYSNQGDLLSESRIETGFSSKKEKINRRMNSYLPGQKPGKYYVFRAAEIIDDVIYVMDHIPPRIWIWAIEPNLKISHTFWANTGDSCSIKDFCPTFINGRTSFLLLGVLTEDGEKRIHILSPK